MKKIIYIISLVLCFCFTSEEISSAASINDTKKEAGFISLNSTIVKEAEPNLASVSFAVENTADTAKKASETNNITANKVINAIKTIISKDTDTIKTTGFAVTPVYSTSQGKRTIKNYKAVNSVTVETKDISKVSNIIDTALANGANRTNSLNYLLQNEKSYCNQAYPEILKDLKAQASVIASAAGTSIDGIKHINASCSVNSFAGSRTAYAKTSSVSADDSSESSTPVEAGKVKVRIYVSADFYVK